jgi:hypothetical protein
MIMTFSGICTASIGADAQEPPRDVGAPADSPRPAPEPSDAGAPTTETKAPATALPGGAEKSDATAPPGPAEKGAPTAPGPAEPVVAGAEEGEKEKKHKKKKDANADGRDADGKEQGMHAEVHGRFGAFELKGRVYARAEYDRSEVILLNDELQPVQQTLDSFDLSVPVARASLHYQAPMKWLTAVAELDIAGKPKMKDAYLQARNSRFTVRAGQFKMPVSALESTSPWTLPLVRKGLIHDVLIDRLDYGGRRPGVIVGYHEKGVALHPRLTIGAFQGSYLAEEVTPIDRDTDLINGQDLISTINGRSQSLVARAEIDLAGVEVGAYYEDRVGSPALFEISHYWTAGADAYYERSIGTGGVRLWAEGISGASWYELQSKAPDNKDAVFVTVRALAAYRFGGATDEAFYIEPYVLGAALDPDATVTEDLMWEGVVGINVGYWRRARLSLQGEINKAQRNFPEGYYAGPPPDRIGVILQAGVAF